jgi:hypothetical protein
MCGRMSTVRVNVMQDLILITSLGFLFDQRELLLVEQAWFPQSIDSTSQSIDPFPVPATCRDDQKPPSAIILLIIIIKPKQTYPH